VGTESEKLIEPIANRKDGIQAMFTKQKEGKGKRMRMEDEDVKSQDPNSSPSNKSKYGVWDKGKSPKPETTPSKAKPESTQSQDINRLPSPAKKVRQQTKCTKFVLIFFRRHLHRDQPTSSLSLLSSPKGHNHEPKKCILYENSAGPLFKSNLMLQANDGFGMEEFLLRLPAQICNR